MTKSAIARAERKLINTALGVARQLWMKGIPLKLGNFEFHTSRKQRLFKGKLKKTLKKPYYVITFDAKELPINTKRGHSVNNVRRYNLTIEKILLLKAKKII